MQRYLWKTSNVAFQTLWFEKVRENDTRKTINIAFQMLRFEKVRENEMFL
jgi:hypothetical protein